MAELRPFPFAGLITRMLRELEERGSVFDLPRRRFYLGRAEHDPSVTFHGRRAATALGPAAGPQSQMAQNLVLSWLGGSRILELKTVQVDDELVLPRPCIDMQTVGYNVEWSQELKLEESLEEYVKGAMLIRILVASGLLGDLPPGFTDTLYDLSVGYDLAGIRSERVQAFLHGAEDCSGLVDRLRDEIPAEYARFRDLDFEDRLSDTLTLSTFHGCPPDEIERIVEFLLEHHGLNTIVKLNPMLLGPERTRGLLNDTLGYGDLRVPDTAFERDTRWDQMEGFVERLGTRAASLGRGFGVKFTNTLIVENHREFFPADEKEMYLSGPPLHVLAMNLVGDFRARFGDRYPVSFSAGIDRKNFPDAVALGIVPVTVCSDLLKPGGYGRSVGYFDELHGRMERVGARTVDEFVLRAFGHERAALDAAGLAGDEDLTRIAAEGGSLGAPAADPRLERWLSAARLLNTQTYVQQATEDPRYGADANRKVPKKIGSHLELFDCITCDKCVPVCPNDANFTFDLEPCELPIVKVRRTSSGWQLTEHGTLRIEERHQLANFADFCNDCGNCDVFCPEDGGPYVIKPRFFGTEEDWRGMRYLDGFCLTGDTVHGRLERREYRARELADGVFEYAGDGFRLELVGGPSWTVRAGEADGEVDLTPFRILLCVRDGVLAEGLLTYPALRR